jgi:hypothetical protein
VSTRVKEPGREADHYTPPSAEIKKCGDFACGLRATEFVFVCIPPLPHRSSCRVIQLTMHRVFTE